MNASVTSISQGTGPKREAENLQRVVLQFGDHVLRGFTDEAAWSGSGSPEQILLRAVGSDEFAPVALTGLKAAFFVKRFDGPGLDEMRFHDHLHPQASLWVRVVFQDGEVIEGLVDNRADFVLKAGFLLTPTDPEANHWLIYVAKAQVRDFQVLGLRSASK